MKILTVSGGNFFAVLNPGIREQGESLRLYGVEVDHFTIKGTGFMGYLKNVKRIKRQMQLKKYDIIHAHYSLSAIASILAGAKPLVVSLMGSDVQSNFAWRLIIKFFCYFFGDASIVKSKRLADILKLKNYHVIPNGVNFKRFNHIPKETAKTKVGFKKEKKYILFVGNQERKEKNIKLAQKAFNLLNNKADIELIVIQDIDFQLMPNYMYAADVLLLTSLWEGSPNVVKEAMAANLPIVATDVGDVREVIGKTGGCYVTTFEPEDVAEKLKMALTFEKRTDGREDIKHLELKEIAKKVIKVYEEVTSNSR
jgi:glycosyltransferase involved in cell wall biosynthesis